MDFRRSSATSNTRLTVALPEEGVHLPSTSNLSVHESYSDSNEPFLRPPSFDTADFLPSSHRLGLYIGPQLGRSLSNCFDYRFAITEAPETSEIGQIIQINHTLQSAENASVFQNAIFYENPNYERRFV